MPNVTINYLMFLPGGHHRQPRNTSVDLSLAPAAVENISPMGVCNPPFFPVLPYTLGGGSGMASLVFWSVTDGTTGQVLPPAAFSQTVGVLPMTITAWYFPTSGPGTSGGGPEIIDDAFSADQGQFIDDTFVTVTSDPSLTTQANVVGIVPTSVAETLVAANNVVSTPEPFYKWVLNGSFMPAGNTTLHVAAGTIGIAVAIYQSQSHSVVKLPPPSLYNPWWWIYSWWGHGPDPGPEWVGELAVTLQLGIVATQVAPELQVGALKLAQAQLAVSAASLKRQIESPESQ